MSWTAPTHRPRWRCAPRGSDAKSDDLRDAPALVIASEPMDGESGWRQMDPGELVHVDAGLTIDTSRPLPDPPVHPLTLADLSPTAAASQGASAQQTT